MTLPALSLSFGPATPHGRGRLAWTVPVVAASLLTACLHRPDPDAMARAAPAPTEAALLTAAERVALDPVAFEAARQRTPAAPRAEAPPAPRPAAPTVRRLSVAFGVGSTRLATDQAAAVKQLAQSADRNARWRIMAQPETVGGRETRQRLARLRADRVVEQLMRAGVDRRAITVAQPGEAGAVPAEPQAAQFTGKPQPSVAAARRVDIEATETPVRGVEKASDAAGGRQPYGGV